MNRMVFKVRVARPVAKNRELHVALFRALHDVASDPRFSQIIVKLEEEPSFEVTDHVFGRNVVFEGDDLVDFTPEAVRTLAFAVTRPSVPPDMEDRPCLRELIEHGYVGVDVSERAKAALVGNVGVPARLFITSKGIAFLREVEGGSYVMNAINSGRLTWDPVFRPEPPMPETEKE